VDESKLKKYTIAEYIFIDGTGLKTRGKTRVFNHPINSLDDLIWMPVDGSSTGQATTESSEIYLKPVFYCPDPFRKHQNILVLCETY
jgi:glutamine synthetase